MLLNTEDPCSNIIAAIMFVLLTIVHSVIQYIPGTTSPGTRFNIVQKSQRKLAVNTN